MRCNNCGWDNPDGSQRCEKCNAPFEHKEETNPAQSMPLGGTLREGSAPISEEPVSHPSGPDAVEIGGTVPPWMQMQIPQTRFCKLIPMENMPNERHLPGEIELQGDSIELNRDNLEPSNNTISQKTQAILVFEDGQWYIEDKSSYQTTYIHAAGKTPIKSGDVILMGNRRFTFTEE